MPATIDQFDFGLRANVIVPSREPSPDDHVAYTIFHVSRALDYHQTKGNTTIEPILNYFGPQLKVVRAIQPLQRFRRGELVNLGPKYPAKPYQAAAILLYALTPGEETERCASCIAQQGSGPFALCIAGYAESTKGSCLSCYYTGSSECDMKKRHEKAQYLQQRETFGLNVAFPAGAEKAATTDVLSVWLRMIEAEIDRRKAQVTLLMAGKTA